VSLSYRKTTKDKVISAAVYDLISQLIMKQVVDKKDLEGIWGVVAPLTYAFHYLSISSRLTRLPLLCKLVTQFAVSCWSLEITPSLCYARR